MITVKEILDFLDSMGVVYDFFGNEQTQIEGFSTLKNYKANTVTWAKNEKAYNFSFEDKLLVIAQDGLQVAAQNVVSTKQSKQAFFALVEYMAEKDVEKDDVQNAIGKGTFIGKNVKLGKNVTIGSNCVIDGDIVIGDKSKIWHNVTIMNRVNIGKNCEIQSGCVIGHDGFAWNEDENHVKTMIRHFGGVEIKDDTYIGPNCIIDRGEIDFTTIGKGNKIDGNCFIAHNVVTGENSIMITGTRLYGSSELGDNAYVASATVRNQCKIGENTFVGMGAVVVNDIPSNVVAAGVPAKIITKEK